MRAAWPRRVNHRGHTAQTRRDVRLGSRGLAVARTEVEVIQPMQVVGTPTPPEPGESGWKDTVTAYPGEVTRLRMRFVNPGQFVWHCHIVEHEDNEMMRPYRIGAVQPGQP